MKFKLTDLGKLMEAQLIAGSKPIITRIEASDAYSSNDTALLSVQNKKQDLEIEEIVVVEGASHLRFVLHNVGLAEEYMLRQVGIYARQQEDAEEILYIIGQDKIGERVPATSEKLVEYEYNLMIHTENTYGAEVVVKGSYFATKKEMEEIREQMVDADDGDISNTKLSVFDDFEIGGEEQPGEDPVEVPAVREAVKEIKKGNKISVIISNIKAALMGLVTLGEMRGLLVNNGLCAEPGKFFLDAAYGKNLQDQLTKLNSDLRYKAYNGNWNDMPDGLWTVSSNGSNSPLGNDGYYWRVFCDKSVLPFQQAYRLSGDAKGTKTYFRYGNGTVWGGWYQPYVNNNDNAEFFKAATGNVTHGMNGIYVGRFDNAIVGEGRYCIYIIYTRSNTTMVYAFPATSYSDKKIFLNRMNQNGVWDNPEFLEFT